jgi:hypothetical protein
MNESAKQQSNPFSTGSGGANFETRVQAAFIILMLSGRLAPCLPPFPITKIKLQGRYIGFNTDDFIVFSKQQETEKEAKLLAQIKHDINITAKDATFAEVIQSTWNDFNDESFDSSTDALALITGPLSATDINDVRPILEWARYAENEEEFFAKINTANFSSDAKRKKLETFKTHLKTANGGTDVSDRKIWEFLKVFYIIGYDLDTESGSTLSLIHSLIAQYSNEAVPFLWARVVDAVQTANQNAGTLTLESLPEDIRTAFSTVNSSGWSSDVSKLKEHGNYILGGIRTTVGGIHINQADAFAQLLSLTEISSFVFVSGERGAGKSSLIREFSDYTGKRIPIFCLRTEDLDQAHLDKVLLTEFEQITLRTHSSWHILSPCLMISDGSREPSHIKFLSKMLTFFFEVEQKDSNDKDDKDDRLEINYKVKLSFAKRFAQYLFDLRNSKFEYYIEQLRMGCKVAPSFIDYFLLCFAVEAERKRLKEVYWQLWKELSQEVQKIAVEVAGEDSDYKRRDDRRKLIRCMLKADLDWQKIDYETQDIALGKDLLLEFVTNAGKNPDVFEALASLMYHFPSIFFESGVHVLSKHQKQEGGTRLLSGVNTAFYLERSIQRFLHLDQTGPLPRSMHESCFVLLNAIVEAASSRAYYLREHLIRSRKIL